MAPKAKSNTKRTIKFLASCHQPDLVHHLLRTADNKVVKGICNAALNVTKGEVPLTKRQKKLFAKYRPVFDALTSPTRTVESKKQVLQSGGAFPLIPILLSTVLSTLGSALFSR